MGVIPPKRHSVSMIIEIKKDLTNKLAKKKKRSGENAVEQQNRAYNLERT